MFDNFGKVYVSIEDLAVRRMYVDPDRLLFMFDEPILIFQVNGFVYPPSERSSSNGGESYKNSEILRYLTENLVLQPVIRRYSWTRCLSI